MKSISASPYKNYVTKKLIKLLQSELKYLNQTYEFKHEIFSFLRERSIKLKESPLNPEIRLELTHNRKYYILTFKSGLYPNTHKQRPETSNDPFPFQISYNIKTESLLAECYAVDSDYAILRCFLTTHPILLKRNPSTILTKEYRGPLPIRLKGETIEAFRERFEEEGFNMEFIQNCMNIARDKEERLKSEWIENILKFINS